MIKTNTIQHHMNTFTLQKILFENCFKMYLDAVSLVDSRFQLIPGPDEHDSEKCIQFSLSPTFCTAID